MEFTPHAASAPQPATLRPIIERPNDDTSMECVEHGDGGAVGPARGDSYVEMNLAGKVTSHRAFFPFCLDHTSICNGRRRDSCLHIKEKAQPSIAMVLD
jgi:hypothetical protein